MAKPKSGSSRGVPRRAGKKGKRKGGLWYQIVHERGAKRHQKRIKRYQDRFPLWRGVPKGKEVKEA